MRMMIGIVTMVFALWGLLSPAALGQDANAPVQEKPRKPHFTIGKDTTYFTEPVDKDGYIDYVTAVNERLRRGVTPDNNAVALRFRTWVEREIAYSARRMRKSKGIRPEPAYED